ncbi:MAG: hypothetical protein EA415_15900 [Sphaerobacteraceae bacterium]|nr:MAG: hypothetical protein EA415_15900 [Sphaerobacteraceae bacterium]
MRWISILMLAVVLAGCGGDDDAESVSAEPASTSPVTAAATGEPADSDNSEADNSGNGSTSIIYTGAHSGEINDEGSCGDGASGDGLELFTSLYDEDQDVTWMFKISIPAYDGPGQYEVGQSLLADGTVSFDDTSVTFSNNADEGWGSTLDQGGLVVVNADEVSGTVEATLVAEEGSSEINVSGAWTCTSS